MSSNNTIAIIGNKPGLISQISSKLVLLRDLDKVVDTNSINALPFLREHLPNVIIIHCDETDKGRINLVRDIRKEPLLKNAPILLIGDMLSRDFVLDAFDAGISDVIYTPVQEHELLMRVIWCIAKNELNTVVESRSKFLASLGIIQEETGFYTSVHGNEFLINEVDYAIKYHISSCIMFLTPENKQNATTKEFWDTVKKSVRINDSVVTCEDGRFYLFLPKTKLNGVYAVFERMNANLGESNSVCAGVIEVRQKSFLEIRENLEFALKKACENKKSLIITSEDSVENPSQETVALTKETVLRSGNWFETQEGGELCEDISTDDEHSEKLFMQTYRKKSKLVIEPVFKKYAALLGEKYPGIEAELDIEQSYAKLIFRMKGVISSFNLKHTGFSRVKIEIQHALNGEIRSSNSFCVELTDFSYQKLSEIIDAFCVDFSNIMNMIAF